MLVEYRREHICLSSVILSAAKRVIHRHRLVHQKQETTRVLTTDFGLVCHGFPPLFLASRELRLSHARGHRLESCRDHPQNAATPGPADRVSRLTLRPSQAASIPAIPPCPLSPGIR